MVELKDLFECKGYPHYFISKEGKVYSSYVVGGQGRYDNSKLHELKYSIDKYGYRRVVLSYFGKRKYIHIHTLMAKTFIRDLKQGEVINHLDGNKQNNNLDNLEITTVKENVIHAHRNGLCKFDIKVDVKAKDVLYHFNSMEECMRVFPILSKCYLNQLRNNEILFSNVCFVKDEPHKRIGKISCYWNGSKIMAFNTMQDADKYFNKKRGTVSSTFNSTRRYEINKFHVSFPNVSTIEN